MKDFIVAAWRLIEAVLDSHFVQLLLLLGFIYLLMQAGVVGCDAHPADGCF